MTESNSSYRRRSNKFPLTLHKTGQYCKKIRGKLYYFGMDKKRAMERYLEQAAFLHAGRSRKAVGAADRLSIKTLCNLYLDHQESRAAIGELRQRHLSDQVSLLRAFVQFIGPNRAVSDISTIELQDYRRSLINSGKAANTINNRLAAVKSMYHWALDNEIIERSPRLRAVKKVRPRREEREVFTIAQISLLLKDAGTQMRSMIWLGLNCGFGCTDCAELKWRNLDLNKCRVSFPRGKTGVSRNLPLWPETVQSLQAVERRGELVFYTRRGHPWVRTICTSQKDGRTKYTKDDAITKEFSKLIRKVGIDKAKGVGFYTLRRTAATMAAASGDPFAVQKLLGHADLTMASTYVQDVSRQTDRVVNDVRKLIIQGDS